MTEITKTGNDDFQNAYKNNSVSGYEPLILNEEAVDEQICNYLAFLTKQLELLTLLIQGMTQAFRWI